MRILEPAVSGKINVVKLYREKVNVLIFDNHHSVEPQEPSNPEKPADENAPILSLSWNSIKYGYEHYSMYAKKMMSGCWYSEILATNQEKEHSTLRYSRAQDIIRN
jgi:hypothetical protein